MKTLEEEISALKDVITDYETQLKEAGISDAKWNRLSDLVFASRNNLDNLQKEKLSQSAGKLFVAY